MWSVTKLIGLVIIPLMIGSAVLGSLQTMKTESVDDKYNAMDAILERENNKVYIDQNVMERARNHDDFSSENPGTEIFRDVIATSQLTAISCTKTGQLISGQMLYANTEPSSEEVERNGNSAQGFSITIPRDTRDRIEEATGDEDAYKEIPWHTFPGRLTRNPFYEKAPNYAVQFTEYTPRCVGVQNAESVIPGSAFAGAINGFLSNPIDYTVGGTIDTVISAGEGVWNYFSCTSTPQWAKTSGNDMEGRYGRVPFELSENLEEPIILAREKPGDIRRDAVWTANFIVSSQDDTCWQGYVAGAVTAVGVTGAAVGSTLSGNPAAGATIAVVGAGVVTSYDWGSKEIEVIPSLAGLQFARYAPYSVDVIDGDANWPGINLKLGHVVVDAPVVLDSGDESYIETGDPGDDERGVRFGERAKYVLCPGTKGYIQTNRDDGGRSGGEHTVDQDHMPSIDATKITTYIHVTGGDPDSCVEDGGNYVLIDDRVSIEYHETIEVDQDD